MSTIRQRLTWRLLLGWILLLGTGEGTAYFLVRTALTRQFDEALHAKAMALAALSEQDGGRIEMELPPQFMGEFDTPESTAFFQLWRADGSVVRRSKSLRHASLPRRCGTLLVPECWNQPLPDGAVARAMGFKFQPPPANESKEKTALADAVLVVATDRRSLDKTLATLAGVLAGCGLLILTLTAGTMPILLRRELAPLDHLAEQTQHIDADSLSARFLTAGLPGELAPITTRLNDLLARLQKAFDRERQFSADLAHELRTPLAELRSLAELALKWPDARDAEFDGHVLAIALRMELMVTRLLAIVRSEHGQFSVSCEPVCVSDLVSAVCQPLQVKAAARRLAIEVDVPAAFEIHSDPVVLRSIMTNLVENAVEYSPPGGTVCIHSDAQKGRFNLAVTNPVEHLAAADLPNLGDRFWRKDAARSSRDHSGLGLSVVRALAAVLGCNLRATMKDPAWLSMTVSGPIKPRNHSAPPVANSGKTEKPTQ